MSNINKEIDFESKLEIREIYGTNGFYNAAAWQEDGETYLLGRQVKSAGGEGEPDVGSLILQIMDRMGNIAISREVWRPKIGGHLLEDARALTLPDGKIAFGLTSVIKYGNDYVPRPAVLVTSTEELMNRRLPEPKIIKDISHAAFIDMASVESELKFSTGKNVTAITPDLFAFRPEGTENNHRLQIFDYAHDQDNGEVSHNQYIDFPNNIPWAEYKIGTTISPIWLNHNEAFLPIHGITIINNKYVYSIGAARMLRDKNGVLSVDNITKKPIIDPDLFVGRFDDADVELHNERRVVYCCGGIPVNDENGQLEKLKMYINVGDKRTVEVTIPASEIIRSWSGISAEPSQLLS